jgi:predicted RNA-binding Zn-ribbon protein involved in translation (DUF1610 family)
MIETSSKDILNWILSSFPVSKVNEGEVQFPCPDCGHDSHYFNIKKKIGFCHRSSCHRKTSLEYLTDLIGYGPELSGYVPEFDSDFKSTFTGEVSLPEGLKPATEDEQVMDFLINIRGLKFNNIKNNKIQCREDMIVVPVYHEGKLVQYLGRFIDRSLKDISKVAGRRYDYFKGAPITNFFYNWDQCKREESITLVENTFNAISYSNYFNCTSTFGSHLSDSQVSLLVSSMVKTVFILWDEGANWTKASRALREQGIRATGIYIKGQPDDHSIRALENINMLFHSEMKQGNDICRGVYFLNSDSIVHKEANIL